jgi:hypothetical protein
MAAHAIHDDVEAVLCAGCEECEWRAKNLPVALAQMDPEQIDHAWRRAIAWTRDELLPNEAELPLFEVIHAFALLLGQRKVLAYGEVPGEPKPGFRLVLELGNTAMSEPEDVAHALTDVRRGLLCRYPEALIKDRNGNTVGRWSLTLPPRRGAGDDQCAHP